MRRFLLMVRSVMLLVAVFFGSWMLTYPSPGDAKNLRYVLWKAGLCKISLEQATSTMVGDGKRNELVLGKTKSQLRSKFGSLLPVADASPYLRGCYQNSPWKDGDVLFLGQSPWMVIFHGDRATGLVLVKGC